MLWVRLLRCCDACTVDCFSCVYAERMLGCEGDGNAGVGSGGAIVAVSGSNRHSLHAVELSHWYGKPCTLCLPLPQWGPDYRIIGQSGHVDPLAMLLIKAGDVETNDF